MEEEKEMCMNCKRDVSCSNYQMHTAHCARHITLCKKCDEPVPKKDIENHKCGENDEETKVDQLQPPQPPPQVVPKAQPRGTKKEISTSSSSSGTRPKMQSQPSSIMPKNEIKRQQEVVPDKICQYCKLEFTQKQLDEHEDYCGSRTEQCPECSDYVMLKEWEKHASMRLYHELAKKPSAVVFKNENTRSSLQRSASGIAIPNYEHGNTVTVNGLGRKSSQSNLYSYLQKGSPSNYSKPFGDGLQSSSFKASNDYIPRKAKYSFDASLLNDKKEELFAGSSRLDRNFPSETKLERRNSITHSANRLDRSRRNSGTYGSRTLLDSISTSSLHTNQTDFNTDDAAGFGTSIDEQRKILEEIQRQQRRRSISRSRANIDNDSSSSSSYRYRAKSSYTEYQSSTSNTEEVDSINAGPPPNVPKRRARQNSVTFNTTPEQICTTKSNGSSSSIVDRYKKNSDGGMEQHSSRASRRDEFMKTEKVEERTKNADMESRSKSITTTSATSSTKRKKSSIVDQILSKGADSFCETDTDLPDLLPFDTNFQALNKKLPSRFDRNAQNVTHYSTSKKSSETRSYSKSSTSSSFVEQHSTSSQQSSSQKSRKRSTSRTTLCRQNSVSNLSSLQDEISSMLNTPDDSKKYQSYTSNSTTTRDHSSTSVIRSEHQSPRAVQARCSYESIARSMLSEPPVRRRHVEGFDNTETNRETLREMLSKMRRDPFDDEVEKSDGEFFPCEFCGDPYPVEYLMRHQLSCDLNPNPVQEGNGFDYSEIARRAAATMALAKQ